MQGEVWREVAETAGRHGVNSPHRRDARRIRAPPRPTGRSRVRGQMHCSQVGMLAAIGGRFVVLDHVSEVEAFAALHGPLVQGYALDAIGAPDASPPSIEDARDFIELLMTAPCAPGPAVGLGEGLQFSFGGLSGTGLICDGELVTLTAFADEPGANGPATAGRVRRPSRRRPG